MRPTDPRLLARLGPARRPLTGVLLAGVLGSVVVIGQAWIVAGLVVAVVDGTAVRQWALAVLKESAAVPAILEQFTAGRLQGLEDLEMKQAFDPKGLLNPGKKLAR